MQKPQVKNPADIFGQTSVADTPSTQVKVSLPPRLYQRICQLADAAGQTVPGYLRYLALKRLEETTTPQPVTNGQPNDDLFWLAERSASKKYTTKK